MRRRALPVFLRAESGTYLTPERDGDLWIHALPGEGQRPQSEFPQGQQDQRRGGEGAQATGMCARPDGAVVARKGAYRNKKKERILS